MSYVDYDEDDRCSYVESRLSVDGVQLSDEFSVNWKNLVESCFNDGDYFILTCVCGDPGCAGIERAFQISCVGKNIKWEIPKPITGCHSDDKEIAYVEKVFDLEDYRQLVHYALCEVKTLALKTPPPVKLTPAMLDMEGLLGLISKMESF